MLNEYELFEKFMSTKFWKSIIDKFKVISVVLAGSHAIGFVDETSDTEYQIFMEETPSDNDVYTSYCLQDGDDKYDLTLIFTPYHRIFPRHYRNEKIAAIYTTYSLQKKPILVLDEEKNDVITAILEDEEVKQLLFNVALKYFFDVLEIRNTMRNQQFTQHSHIKSYYKLLVLYRDICKKDVPFDLIMNVKQSRRRYLKEGYFLTEDDTKSVMKIFDECKYLYDALPEDKSWIDYLNDIQSLIEKRYYDK